MLDSIESAIQDIKNGKLVIVVDDEDRENEGDFITAAENVTPEIINFMSTYGRGLICAPLLEDRCNELHLQPMVSDNTSLHETPFTVSIDLLGHGCTTGISAHDRAKTIQALVDPTTKPEDLGRPGHIFPLKAKTPPCHVIFVGFVKLINFVELDDGLIFNTFAGFNPTAAPFDPPGMP